MLSKTPSFNIHDENKYSVKPSIAKKNNTFQKQDFGIVKKVQINAKTPEKITNNVNTKSNRKALSNLSTSQINSRFNNQTINKKVAILIDKPKTTITTTIAPKQFSQKDETSSIVENTTIEKETNEIDDEISSFDPDDYICTKSQLEEDPYDIVMRRATENLKYMRIERIVDLSISEDFSTMVEGLNFDIEESIFVEEYYNQVRRYDNNNEEALMEFSTSIN